MQQRNYDHAGIYRVAELYEQVQQLEKDVASFDHQRNLVNQSIRQARDKQERQQRIDEAKAWKDRIKDTTIQLDATKKQLEAEALHIPNDTHPDVPVGDESKARLVRQVGEPRTGEVKDHLALAEAMDMVDFEQASKVTGSKWYYLKNQGVWLELALIQYAMQQAYAHKFSPVLPPDVVRTSVAYGCGFQPRQSEASQIYNVSTPTMEASAPPLCLAGTAEIPLTGLFADQMLEEDTLPRKVVGFSHAFRAEAGHGSAQERGLYRVHQFSKVELFAVSTPDQSDAILSQILALQEAMFQDLGLCYRVLDMPTEELGASAYRKYDIEAWMPGKNDWGEISSTSNCTDYQARRLGVRYVAKDFKEHVGGKNVRVPWHIKEQWVHYCHTLNGTAMAIPRIIIALLETHQRPDGSVYLPRCLRKWIPGEPSELK
ncbi:seryl-tRNA synthetase [Hesseltinella vesiculosa]|uniref:serine--tRNA ligase n=1 Tax=Hesseltinella vesiculosa TaxID=101127 RepID=A0A1X2GTS4_9FUNG|nr:seryl-tRNA synthetase [Hesseltinella vesiculosa]